MFCSIHMNTQYLCFNKANNLRDTAGEQLALHKLETHKGQTESQTSGSQAGQEQKSGSQAPCTC